MGAEAPYGAVPPSDAPQPGRRCGASTVDVEALANGWAACGLTTVALESPEGSWIPRCALLETHGVEGVRVEPPPVPKITGRPKRDVHAWQGRQRRHPVGLLASACRPPEQVCGLRSALRQRAMVLPDASQHSQPMPKALTQRPRTRQPGVSEVTGETGMARIRAMRAGDRAPVT